MTTTAKTIRSRRRTTTTAPAATPVTKSTTTAFVEVKQQDMLVAAYSIFAVPEFTIHHNVVRRMGIRLGLNPNDGISGEEFSNIVKASNEGVVTDEQIINIATELAIGSVIEFLMPDDKITNVRFSSDFLGEVYKKYRADVFTGFVIPSFETLVGIITRTVEPMPNNGAEALLSVLATAGSTGWLRLTTIVECASQASGVDARELMKIMSYMRHGNIMDIAERNGALWCCASNPLKAAVADEKLRVARQKLNVDELVMMVDNSKRQSQDSKKFVAITVPDDILAEDVKDIVFHVRSTATVSREALSSQLLKQIVADYMRTDSGIDELVSCLDNAAVSMTDELRSILRANITQMFIRNNKVRQMRASVSGPLPTDYSSDYIMNGYDGIRKDRYADDRRETPETFRRSTARRENVSIDERLSRIETVVDRMLTVGSELRSRHDEVPGTSPGFDWDSPIVDRTRR